MLVYWLLLNFTSIIEKKNQNWLWYGTTAAWNRGEGESFLMNNCRFSLFLRTFLPYLSCRFQPSIIIMTTIMCVLLSSACLFRYNGLSLVYFLFVLTVPVLPNPSLVTMKGERRKSKMCTVTEHLENTKRIFVTSSFYWMCQSKVNCSYHKLLMCVFFMWWRENKVVKKKRVCLCADCACVFGFIDHCLLLN